MARKCVRCMRGRATFLVEVDDYTQHYICRRCYEKDPGVATLIVDAPAEDEDG